MDSVPKQASHLLDLLMTGDPATVLAEKNWIASADRDIEKRGTKGVCTGSKFGSPSCPKGSKRYALAKTFKKMAHESFSDGGVDELPDPSSEIVPQDEDGHSPKKKKIIPRAARRVPLPRRK